MTTLSEWDARWVGHYERARENKGRPRTPNQAVVIADRLTEEELGVRPVEAR